MSDNLIYLIIAAVIAVGGVVCYLYLKNKNKATVQAKNTTAMDEAIAEEFDVITNAQKPIIEAEIKLEELNETDKLEREERLKKLAELARNN